MPHWPTDRLRRQPDAPPDETLLVTAASDGRRLAVAAVDRAAGAAGLYPGMSLAQARAMVPGLCVVDAEPEADAGALRRLALWCLRYAPLCAADPPDGIWIDATGCAALHGGEAAMLQDMQTRLAAQGIATRTAMADTAGCAHAVARHGAVTLVPPGEQMAALADLPVAALRLPGESVAALRRLGFERIAQLAAAPRAPLVRRFGPALIQRLDQAYGRVPEPLQPLLPEAAFSHRLAFVEPLLTAEAFTAVIARLVPAVCTQLEHAGQGARGLDLLFERVDGTVQAARIGTARPARDPAHLARLLTERLEQIDPGPGVEAMRLLVTLAEEFVPAQISQDGQGAEDDIAGLIDRIENRLGVGRVWRAAQVASDVPERAVARVPPLAPVGGGWPEALPRPVRLLDPPQPVEAMALLPDQPPVAFTWRRHRHRLRRADGPERIFGEWWRSSDEADAVRDYFAVEDEDGRRFWLFRRGNGADPATGDLRWFLHGLF